MTLEAFFDRLDRYRDAVPLDVLVQHMRDVELTRADIENVVCFCDEHYKRNLLRLGDGYAALILCWQNGQASPIHDHRGSACGVRVIQGTLTETQYEKGPNGLLQETCRNIYPEGAVCGSYDADIHVIESAPEHGTDLITLHVYTPPLQNFRIYELGSTDVHICSDEETLAEQRRRAEELAST